MRTFPLAMCSVVALLSTSAHAGWARVLPGSIQRVAAAGDRAAVVRDGTVVLVREDGSPLGRVGGEDTSSGPREQGAADTERLFDLLGIEDSERDEDWAADELESERTLRARRASRRPASLKPREAGVPVVASTDGQIWIGVRGALWRLDERGELAKVISSAQAIDHLAVGSGGRMVMAKGAHLVFLAGLDHVRHHVDSEAPIHQLALSASGRSLAWSDGSSVMLASDTDALAAVSVSLPGPARALAFCEETLMVLESGGLTAIASDGTTEPRASDLDAERIICSSGEKGPWLAVGPGLLASGDQGRTWSSVPGPPHARVIDAAVGERCLWLATDRGLYCSSAQSQPTEGADAPTLPRRRPRAAPWWSGWLPDIVIQAGLHKNAGEREVQGLVYARLPLGIRPLAPVLASVEGEAAPARPSFSLPPDGESRCLVESRARAVRLAMAEPERARSYVRRARHAAWLPEVRVRAERRIGRSESLDIPAANSSLSSPLGLDTVDDVRYEVRATWDLARLVFSSEELAAQTQALHMAEARRDIETTVSRLYFERRRLRLAEAVEPLAAAQRGLRVSEIESELDALSGGTFSACIEGRATPGEP